MDQLEGKVAVVTGGGSGIGRAVATQLADAGMHVVVADVQEDALDATVAALVGAGHRAIGVRTDVSDGESVQALADAAIAEFGAVHVVHNNAGVGVGGPIWTHTERDWEWVLGVNLWGVIHGIRVFVPIMLEQGGPAHVVNTASMAGLISVPYLGAYNVSKHGVVTLSETLHRDLRLAGSEIGVSVLCPGLVATNIFESQRNRPADLTDDGRATGLSALLEGAGESRATEDAIGSFGQVLSPDEVGAVVVDAVRTDRFYVLTHPDTTRTLVRTRLDDVVEARHPSPLRA
ncbi:SDR family NAD(P)-dependent oxidoreductase [Actinomarinicola tropica]|uniref:SDR family NAD(P)-dependent oxidoreductase n=1 Tax=Actinomarinicola tropica TaxID=2789776 RepID=A0A5Q2RJP7_9ACTN|nr:SDR family NAD(P)-dependent oxidoreductase [Actinomarinicola tropica]QGG94070.1 SDR family NAD(P)-dependent oxidoreductase [Actinomarinicola tropica]